MDGADGVTVSAPMTETRLQAAQLTTAPAEMLSTRWVNGSIGIGWESAPHACARP